MWWICIYHTFEPPLLGHWSELFINFGLKLLSYGELFLGVMKRSVKTDVDSFDSINGRHLRSTVNQTELFYWSTSTRLSIWAINPPHTASEPTIRSHRGNVSESRQSFLAAYRKDQWLTSTRLIFSNGRRQPSTSTTELFMVDDRLTFSSRPLFLSS